MPESYAEYMAKVRGQEARDRARFVGDEAASVVYDMRDGSAINLQTDTPAPFTLEDFQAFVTTVSESLKTAFDAIADAIRQISPHIITEMYELLVANTPPPQPRQRHSYPRQHGQWWLSR